MARAVKFFLMAVGAIVAIPAFLGLLLVGYNIVVNFPLFFEHSQETVVYTATCDDFSIPLVLRFTANWIEGDVTSYTIRYKKAGAEKILYSGGIPDYYVHSIKFISPNRIFEEDTQATGTPLSPFPIKMVLSGSDFSEQDFDAIADCLAQNKQQFDSALANIRSYLPSSTELRTNPQLYSQTLRLGGIAYNSSP